MLSLVRKLSLVMAADDGEQHQHDDQPDVAQQHRQQLVAPHALQRAARAGHLGGLLDPGLLVGGDLGARPSVGPRLIWSLTLHSLP